MGKNISIFDLFKIGIGPSSSHTVGPMKAAAQFVSSLCSDEFLYQTYAVKVDLYGSLALTGIGHGTDGAILMGLEGEWPDQIDPSQIQDRLCEIRSNKRINLLGRHPIPFDEGKDFRFCKKTVITGHSNRMQFTAYDREESELRRRIFYSIGGGAIISEGEQEQDEHVGVLPYPYDNADDLLRLGMETQKPIWAMVLENEKSRNSEEVVRNSIALIWQTMKECAARGMANEGVLPGCLKVRRRAPQLHRDLANPLSADPLIAMDWINLIAISINEENAAGGRVVTAPTNGAAGVVPAVAYYYEKFVQGSNNEGIVRYFLTAGAVGSLYKRNASISGAEVGCQGEVGVACSMAAAGLVAALGGTNEQAEHAAEIGMEHTLGMTCDPIAGLVQIPCIERNAFGAVKALTAARMALNERGDHKVSLDQVIRTMYQTGRDMQMQYKETALAGLAVHVVEC